MTAAESGSRVVLIDLDPRAATTKWTPEEPTGERLHIDSILGALEYPIGWAELLAGGFLWACNS
ncbi:cellulose biosynthesis protein BcsQ [Subtercola frigoramans]|uniref:Cellulose biosynthesis protein BcsQ n=1 Tax=Subtercola frigoramans TaxID=120298 RepID=A0ABS2L0I2_9MICO|nr:cellulose biosynthesis protein BcsQ [Subtercola frigoramans]